MARSLIAVINDDTAFLNLMHDLLESEGYRTIIWREGDQAYEMVKRERPDLIILDIRMEKPDTGWMVLETVRLDPVTAQIPAILCSADIDFLRAKVPRLEKMHCDTLEKPFILNELLAKIGALVGHPDGHQS